MKRFDEMNVIPFIDVMLVLLAIVLITASFIVHDALNLDLPITESTEIYAPKHDETALKFSVNAENALFLDEKPIHFKDLSNILQNISSDNPIVIKIDQQAKFKYFVKLIDALKLKELDNLTILTKAG